MLSTTRIVGLISTCQPKVDDLKEGSVSKIPEMKGNWNVFHYPSIL